MNPNIINNINIDLLPEFVQDVLIKEFSKATIKHQLIIYSKLIHGHLFKVTSNDLFNINKQTPTIVYRNFIKTLSKELTSNEHCKRKKAGTRSTNRKKNKYKSKKD